MQLKILLNLFVIFSLSACASGPKVEICILDSENKGFQCATQKKKRFVSFEDGASKLECAEPDNIEQYLKACENHQLIPLTTCKLVADFVALKCEPAEGSPYAIPVQESDNFFCMSRKDFLRLSERCT